MSLNGSEKTGPVRTAAPISDLIAGLYCAFGIVTAINARHNTKKGQVVETSLTSSLISLMAYLSAEYFVTDKTPKKSGNDHPILSPYGLFKTKDGNIAIAPANDKLCEIFLRTLNLEYLLEDDLYKTNSLRMTNREKLNEIINQTTELNTTDYWIKKLNESGCPAGKVLDMKEALNDQLVEDTEMVIVSDGPDDRKIKMTGFPVKLSGTPAQLFRPPPMLGEHTEEILSKIKN